MTPTQRKLPSRRSPIEALPRLAGVPRAAVALVLALAMAALAGCETTTKCGDGFVVVDGACKAVSAAICGEGTAFDLATKTCQLAPDAADSGDAGAEPDDGGGDPDQGGGGTDAQADTGTDAIGGGELIEPDGTCVPACGTRVCGDDGCGGTCGTCPNNQLCTPDGTCVAPPTCNPNCTDKLCGDDGCGGTCGGCGDPKAPICFESKCVAGCVPDCIGKECGEDGCGGTCGACQGEDQCSKIGHCVPKAWTCAPEQFEGADGCHCGCGAKDLDCDLLGQAKLGCGPGEVCDGSGKCTAKVPKGWKCPDFFYDDGLLCHCNCGLLDPDCNNPNNLIADCSAGGCDKAAGVCGACKPICAGNVCGDDGCGGTCGTCADPKLPGCSQGQCVAQCTPSCSGKSCGSDGCGGSCGTCKSGAECSSGSCVAPAGKSCLSHCGYQTVGGCWCDAGCVQRGDCCVDVDHCFCTPSCVGKTCGDNGCGGSCGQCTDAAKPYCDGGACGATCKPNCANKQCGNDGCGGSCGDCDKGTTCSTEQQCVPNAWYCDAHLYATAGPLATCDCGCGAPDPDCYAKGPTTGCPNAATCEADKGTCAAKWCASQGACAKPSWCVGDYAVGDGTRKGVCSPPNPIGYAPGHPCMVDEACGSSLCVAGSCRIHCVVDKDCPSGQACVGDEILQPLTGKPMGVVGFCDSSGTIGKTCAAHKECSGDNLCLALTDPKTLGVMGRCGIPHGGVPEGQSCKEGAECELGLLCVEGQCARACFGGAADCPAKTECKPATLHHGPTASASDDVKVSACSAKAVQQ